jgi:hypothetical protein
MGKVGNGLSGEKLLLFTTEKRFTDGDGNSKFT